MAMTQVERNKLSREKHGIKQKTFALDKDTIALLQDIAKQTGQTQTDVFKTALNLYANHIKEAACK